MSKRKIAEASQGQWFLVDSSPLEYLITPESLSEFLNNMWEKGPKLYKARPERQTLFPKLGTLSALQSLLSANSSVEMHYGIDLNAARYLNGVRENICPSEKTAGLESVMAMYEDGCTLQWHQPQRFLDSLWRLIAAMEKQLGCLVGANAYITPAGTQGLAPHYDDVNLWVCQTEGSKRWRIYENRPGYELPAASSRDFDQDQIGAPILDLTLQVGDVLFMPRGTLHQAVAQAENSSHVTISTFQKWAAADFISALLQTLQQGQPATKLNSATPCLPPLMRRGLPLGFLYSAGLQVDAIAPSSGVSEAAEAAAGALQELANQLMSEPQLTSLTADTLAMDFTASRAPPHPEQLPERGEPPSFSSWVRSMGRGYCRLLPCEPSKEVLDAYPEEKKFVKVISCLRNEIKRHMMHGSSDDSDEMEIIEEEEVEDEKPELASEKNTDLAGNEKELHSHGVAGMQLTEDDSEESVDEEENDGSVPVFPASYTRALSQLLTSEEPLEVKCLRLRTKEDKLGLAYSLWEDGIICTVPEPSRKKAKV